MKIKYMIRTTKICLAVSVIGLIGILSGCGNPSVTSSTLSGPPGSIVEVTGDVLFARIVWDVATPSETILPSGFLGANFFTVPDGAALGNHKFVIERSGNQTAEIDFNVTAAVPVTAPRIDYVTMYSTNFSGGTLNTLLMVQGANIDVGAEVFIDGTSVSGIPYKVMRNNMLGIAPNTLGFPIYHYLAILVPSGNVTAGGTISLQVRNLDNRNSNTFDFELPANQASLDSDGDNIPDDLELVGYDADGDGTIDVDLPALGADPYRRDLFLECDIMSGLTNPPVAGVFTSFQNSFANAPIINIGDKPDGINLVIDQSGTVPFSSTIDLTGADDPAIGFTNFYTLKNTNFNDAVRGRIYHYAIWADARPNGSSGISDVLVNATGTDFSGPGDDLIVSFDNFNASFQTVKSGAETIMHEFGHNLIQRHGGANHFTTNPTYNSVMSYSWQLRSGRNNATRLSRPVCAPFYYGQNGAAETAAGGLFAPVGNIVDYSDGQGINLVENSLNENIGVCNNLVVDWNNDGDSNDNSATRDINSNGSTAQTWTDYCNWCNLDYRGAELNGTN